MKLYSCLGCGKTYLKPLKQCDYCGNSMCYSCNKQNENICLNCFNDNK